MNLSFRWLCLAAIVQLFCPLAAAAAEYAVAPAPAWVVEVKPGGIDESLRAQASDGAYFLLSDLQVRSTADERVRFERFATQALNAKGVESIANIEIGFDPAYQQLTLHQIDVVRAGKVIPKLAGATVRILQRETELEAQIYDGSKSASVFLDDVRVGDVVDVAYSVSGRNPVFGTSEFGSHRLQYSVPVARIHLRLLLPLGDRVQVRYQNTQRRAAASERDGMREYRWNQTNIPALTVDTDAPKWFNPYPNIQWSAFADWGAVVRWAQPLYALPAQLSPALQKEVDRIARAEKTTAGRLLAVLHWVQSEVRYLGVEIGAGSHAPNPPALVFERRFGDCKDKALLTVSMLAGLGIEARAALVNTDLQRGLKNIQPSPGAFDHVMVLATLEGGRFWLDPTRPTQNGDLAHLDQPDLDLALVIDAGERALTPMNNASTDLSKRRVHALLDARGGFEKPVPYTVVTTGEGGRADALRYSLANNSHEEVRKQFVNFYASYYPGISSGGPLEVTEDAVNNRVTTTERYQIADIVTDSDDGKTFEVSIHVPDIRELLVEPGATVRATPLGLSHPVDTTVVTEVLLPEDWSLEASDDSVDEPAFRFQRTVVTAARRLEITDHFVSKVDEIAAADTPRYVASLTRARGLTGYQLTWGKPVAAATAATDASATAAAPAAAAAGALDRFNWLIAMLALAALAFFAWLAPIVWRYDPAPASGFSKSNLNGIGGWLLLPALTVILSPILLIIVLNASSSAYSSASWAALTNFGGAAYHPLWAPILLFELIANLGLLVFSLVLGVLFFKKRSSVPLLFSVFLAARAVVLMIDVGFAKFLPIEDKVVTESVVDCVRAMLHGAIWIAYFKASERVKATFVRRLAAAPPLPLEAPAPAEDVAATPDRIDEIEPIAVRG